MRRIWLKVALLLVTTSCGEAANPNLVPESGPAGNPTAPDGAYSDLGGGTVQFNGWAVVARGAPRPLAFHWDFGDGGSGSDPTPLHRYPAAGEYLAALTVTGAGAAPGLPTLIPITIARRQAASILAGAGNISSCYNDNDEATARLLDGLPGKVFTLGDNAFPQGRPSDYQTCYAPTWGRHRSRTYPVPGNHDYGAGNADGYFGYFGAAGGPKDLGYYSVDYGGWHLVVLNDNDPYVPFAAGSTQERWLAHDLAAHPRKCTLALWHQPLFLSSGTPGFTVRPSRRIIWDRLAAAGVDLVINGHQHHYERMAPMSSDGTRNDSTGIRQFNVGTGGESLALPTAAIHPNSEVRAAVYGVLKLTLGKNRYGWQFLAVPGTTFADSGSGSCH